MLEFLVFIAEKLRQINSKCTSVNQNNCYMEDIMMILFVFVFFFTPLPTIIFKKRYFPNFHNDIDLLF